LHSIDSQHSLGRVRGVYVAKKGKKKVVGGGEVLGRES